MAIIIVDPKRQVKMVKFHIDDHHAFQVKMNFVDQIQRQSECLRDRKVIIGFGQDEAIVGIYPFLSMTEIFTIPQCSHEYPRFLHRIRDSKSSTIKIMRSIARILISILFSHIQMIFTMIIPFLSLLFNNLVCQ